MARLIFCFFAEDTDIFAGSGLFTDTVAEMSARDSANTHEVISEIFRAMNTRQEAHAAANIPRWAGKFPYVNGGLFSGSVDVPRFSKIARSYLLHIGSLDWTQINPDIFGSMIQAVADDEERGALGMHYTSVPNILKVLVKACHGLCECGHTVLFFSKRRKGLNQRLTAFPTYLDRLIDDVDLGAGWNAVKYRFDVFG